MPCYFFTYHGYATWLPDRDRGYVHWKRGLEAPDDNMAERYRENQGQPEVHFSQSMQTLLVETARRTEPHLSATVHGIATEPTHVHVLVSWTHQREGKSMRTSIRSALSRALNTSFHERTWFSHGNSRKRVVSYDHFDYLILEYLPAHNGIGWIREEDREAALRRDEKREVSVRRAAKGGQNRG